MSTCPDCRYCAPLDADPPQRRLPKPARWFDQPCLHCSHRLRAHVLGVPRALVSADLGAGTGGSPAVRHR